MDETFIGGKARNMHKRSARRRSIQGRDPLDRQGCRDGSAGASRREGPQSWCASDVVADTPRRKSSIQAMSVTNVETGSHVYTDALQSYAGLAHRDLRAQGH